MQKINYQKLLDEKIEEIKKSDIVPTLLLHSCCGPCSSYCIEYLSQYFEVTVFYYNPNIYPEEEYHLRAREQERFINEFPTKNPVHFVEGRFDPKEFYEVAKGLEKEPERGERCKKCFELRLGEAADFACKNGFDYFTTTLSISPLKDAALLNEIGGRLGEAVGVPYLFSDFKKKEGYKKSTILAAEYDMYRQDYCGCVYSYNERHGK